MLVIVVLRCDRIYALCARSANGYILRQGLPEIVPLNLPRELSPRIPAETFPQESRNR